MQVINDNLLDEFRAKRRCENCGVLVQQAEPHHLFTKGMGGGGRIDIPENLLALCRLCHQRFHDGNIHRDQFVAVIARRLKTTEDAVVARVMEVRRAKKETPPAS